jgi:transposase
MKYARENIEPEVVQVAKAPGHKIVYSPPNISYMSPIETIWENIKGDIGREYTDETTMKDVEERLLRAFNNVKSKQVAGVIKNTNGHIY